MLKRGLPPIIKEVASISIDERENVLKSASYFINNIPDYDHNGRVLSGIIRAIGKSDAQDYQNVVNYYKGILEKNSTNHWEGVIGALEITPMFLHNVLLETWEKLRKIDPKQFKNIAASARQLLGYVIANEPDFKETICDNWMKNLNSPKIGEVQHLVDFILGNYEDLNLTEIDTVVQEAIRIGTLLETTDDPQNPFNFYKLLAKRRTEVVELDKSQLPTETFDGTTVRLNQGYLKKLPEATILFKDLPKYSKDFFKDMKSEIGKLLKENKDLGNEIEILTGFENKFGTSSYSSLMQSALGSNYLSNLINIKNISQDSVIMHNSAKMVAIVSYIESLDNKPHKESSFSVRQETFLKMLASIGGCYFGKDEGLSLYYNKLPETAKFKFTDKPMAQEFLESTIRHDVEDMFSGENTFFKELIGMQPYEKVKEVSHQSLYVKNLIGKDVGLVHSLKFDTHSQLFYKNLVDQPKRIVIKTFYKYLIPHVLINSVIRNANEELKQHNASLYATLSVLIDENHNEKSWYFSTSTGEITLTHYGALQLLLKIGALQEEKQVL